MAAVGTNTQAPAPLLAPSPGPVAAGAAPEAPAATSAASLATTEAVAAARHPVVIALIVAWLVVVMVWWALAFYPIGRQNAEWLDRTREVCFGAGPNQLPSAYGWIMLVAGPLLFLAAIATTYFGELQLELGRLLRRKRGKVAALAVVALVAGQWLWIGAQVSEARRLASAVQGFTQSDALPEYYPRTELPAPRLPLTDQYGRRLTIDDFAGRPVLLAFVYAHCATVCPTLVTQVLKAKAELPDAKVMLITLDPWRDTPGALPSLAGRWQLPATDIHLFSGEVDEVLAALSAWGMPFSRDERTGVIDHPSFVYVVDAQGRIAYKFNSPSVAWLVEGVKRVARAGSTQE